MKATDKPVEIECSVVVDRPLAVLVQLTEEPDKQVWIPKSNIVEELNDDGVLTIIRWFADKEGLT